MYASGDGGCLIILQIYMLHPIKFHSSVFSTELIISQLHIKYIYTIQQNPIKAHIMHQLYIHEMHIKT